MEKGAKVLRDVMNIMKHFDEERLEIEVPPLGKSTNRTEHFKNSQVN